MDGTQHRIEETEDRSGQINWTDVYRRAVGLPDRQPEAPARPVFRVIDGGGEAPSVDRAAAAQASAEIISISPTVGPAKAQPANEPVTPDSMPSAPARPVPEWMLPVTHQSLTISSPLPAQAPQEPAPTTSSELKSSAAPRPIRAEKPLVEDRWTGAQAAAPKRRAMGGFVWGALRYGTGFTVLALGIAFVLDREFELRSTNSVLMPVTTTLRAPIEGEILSLPVAVGQLVGDGDPIAVVSNSRVDTSHEADLRAMLQTAIGEVQANEARQQALLVQRSEAERHAASFIAVQRDQLSSQLAVDTANLASARAKAREANAALQRADRLFRDGVSASSILEQAQRAASVANADVVAAEQQTNVARARLDAAVAGVFGLDNATDRSVSQQFADQLKAQQDTLAQQHEMLATRVAALRTQLDAEMSRLSSHRDVLLTAHQRMRVVKLLASADEHVRQGQELAVMAECDKPQVMAQVGEDTFRALKLGMPARFSLSDSPVDREGRVAALQSPLGGGSVGLTGSVVLLALQPGSADLACEVGRVGRVKFGSERRWGDVLSLFGLTSGS